MSHDDERGTKGNNGEFNFPTIIPPSTTTAKTKQRKRKSSGDGGAKIIIALIAGAGAAFILALMMLMSHLEADEMSNGLLNSNVGGARGVDDQIMQEEVAQGHASLGLLGSKDRIKDRQHKLISQMKAMKKGYDTKLEKFTRLAGLKPGNPLEKIVHEGEAQLMGVVKGLKGEGEMPKHVHLIEDFKDAIHEGNDKVKQRKINRAKKERV